MSKPKGLISLNEFNDMKSSFNKSIKNNLGTHTSDSVWWSIQDLRDYLDLIESEGANERLEISGVSFNFIAKEDTDKKITLALRPTYNEKGGTKTFQAGSILNKGLSGGN